MRKGMLWAAAPVLLAIGMSSPAQSPPAPPPPPPGALPDKPEPDAQEAQNPIVVIRTSMGSIKAELWSDKAPLTVKNFVDYVKEGFFDGLIFHRVIDGFMIQGGGFTPDMKQKKSRDPIKNEAGKDALNKRGTLAMARTSIVDSATSQFFINLKDNAFLDHRNKTPQGFGYCVFGKEHLPVPN